MEKQCERCGNTFYKQKWESKKYWGIKRFCCIRCSGTLLVKGHKQTENWYKSQMLKIGVKKSDDFKMKMRLARKNGVERAHGGYLYELDYYSPSANKKGQVLQHRLVVERFIGRQLKKTEIVHHINGNRKDNRIENLMVMSQSEHMKLHRLPKNKMND